jgi:hypothetical protein
VQQLRTQCFLSTVSISDAPIIGQRPLAWGSLYHDPVTSVTTFLAIPRPSVPIIAHSLPICAHPCPSSCIPCPSMRILAYRRAFLAHLCSSLCICAHPHTFLAHSCPSMHFLPDLPARFPIPHTRDTPCGLSSLQALLRVCIPYRTSTSHPSHTSDPVALSGQLGHTQRLTFLVSIHLRNGSVNLSQEYICIHLSGL